MKVNNIRISNILSFQYHENIDDCQQINFDHNLNIIIGPNGSGKSNFIEVINQLFKRILIANFTLEESTIDKRRENPDQYRLENTIQTKQIFHTLQRNFHSSKEKKEIKLEVGLSSGDIENLLFIFKNKEEFIELFKYCNPHYAPKFPRFDQLTEADIKSAKAMTIHLTEERESDHRFHPNEEQYTPLQHFIAEYVKYYHLLNYLIYIGNKYESKKWSVLKNTFALIGESRNYNNISSKYTLQELEESERNRIILQIHEENTRYSNAPEPAIFLFVKHRISYLLNKFSNEYLDKKSTKPPFDRLIEDPFFKSIRELLQSTVNLSLEIKKDPNTMQFNFYFVEGNNPYPIDMAALSAGEKSIIHFIFTIYGYDLKDGVMIIDEPESHIHPQIQKKLLKIIMKTMIDFNLQYIIVTHSAILVDFTTVRYSFRFHRDQNNYTRVVHPSINEQDSTLIRFLTYTNSTKLFFVNKILLVEGSSDEYFYRVFLNEMGAKSSNNEDIEVLNIEGKSNFSAWRKFLDKFEIPNYYIGDLDNIFNTSLSIISNQDKCTIEDHLITNNSAIRQNIINDPNYKNKRDFKKALIRHVKTNMAQEWNCITNAIFSKYSERIYILIEGELEDYLGLSSKGLEQIVEFCENNFKTWYQNNSHRSEIVNIFNEILR